MHYLEKTNTKKTLLNYIEIFTKLNKTTGLKIKPNLLTLNSFKQTQNVKKNDKNL